MENEVKTGRIEQVNIDQQMRSAYIDYSMSVIVSRALPDVRDGFKPVHRRVLFGMEGLGLTWTSQTKKSARIVGEVLGKYHPHGDSSVYDAMARMAQDWSLRYPLVFGQGNFGSMDGDPVAAMRYTEAKLSKLSDEVLADLEKDTVDFQNNFDDSLQEPTVLPTKIPLLLLNGSSGIAVGMATNMAPHNLTECCDAICAYIDNPEITVEQLINDSILKIGEKITIRRFARFVMGEGLEKKNENYSTYNYRFWYDWRLSPLVTGVELKNYIDRVLEATGEDKVNIVGRCLGANIIAAYVALCPDHAEAYVDDIGYYAPSIEGIDFSVLLIKSFKFSNNTFFE